MPPSFKNRRFRPSVFGSLLTIAGVAGGLWLGSWQLHRADEKQALLDQFARGQLQTLPYRASAPQQDRPGRYQHVRVEGRYDGEHQVLLDNMPSAKGSAGFRVLTPLHIEPLNSENDRWLLVDRGWVPLGATRADLPDVRIPSRPDVQPDVMTGRLDDLPQPGMRLGENAVQPGDAAWPRILSFPRHEELERLLGRKLEPWILLLDASEPLGFERAWGTDLGIGPPRHIAYAVQWFAMAFAMVCVFLIVSFKVEADR